MKTSELLYTSEVYPLRDNAIFIEKLKNAFKPKSIFGMRLKSKVSDDAIISALVKHTGIDFSVIKSKSRLKDIVDARHIGIYFFALNGNKSEYVANIFCCKYSNVIQTVQRIKYKYKKRGYIKLTKIIDLMSYELGIKLIF